MLSKEQKHDLQQFVGAMVIAIVVIAVIVVAVYLSTGAVSADALRWWTTLATLAVPVVIVVAWRLATRAAREHLSGFERGIDGAEKTMQAVGRGLSATASMARTARAETRAAAAANHDDLLPKVGAMKIIEAPHGDGDIIDL